MSDTDLPVWHPSGKVFLKRAVLGSLILAAIVNGFGLFFELLALDFRSFLNSLITIAISALFYMVVFDEWQNWNRHRNEEWRLSQHSLGFRDTGTSIEFEEIRLIDVKSVRRGFWRGVQIRMTDGRAFLMSYLPAPKQVQAAIQHHVTALQSEVIR